MRGQASMWEEHRKWIVLKRELEGDLEALEAEEGRILEELARVEEQIAYYGTLAKEMKRALDPPRLSGLLRSFGRT